MNHRLLRLDLITTCFPSWNVKEVPLLIVNVANLGIDMFMKEASIWTAGFNFGSSFLSWRSSIWRKHTQEPSNRECRNGLTLSKVVSIQTVRKFATQPMLLHKPDYFVASWTLSKYLRFGTCVILWLRSSTLLGSSQHRHEVKAPTFKLELKVIWPTQMNE